MSSRRFVAFGLLSVIALGGCNFRFKGGESFTSATTPHIAISGESEPVKGDRYANGGIADATGGLDTRTPYSLGAGEGSGDKIDVRYNRPAYGSGQRRGESGSQAAPGHGFSNAPAFQAGPNTGLGGNP